MLENIKISKLLTILTTALVMSTGPAVNELDAVLYEFSQDIGNGWSISGTFETAELEIGVIDKNDLVTFDAMYVSPNVDDGVFTLGDVVVFQSLFDQTEVANIDLSKSGFEVWRYDKTTGYAEGLSSDIETFMVTNAPKMTLNLVVPEPQTYATLAAALLLAAGCQAIRRRHRTSKS